MVPGFRISKTTVFRAHYSQTPRPAAVFTRRVKILFYCIMNRLAVGVNYVRNARFWLCAMFKITNSVEGSSRGDTYSVRGSQIKRKILFSVFKPPETRKPFRLRVCNVFGITLRKSLSRHTLIDRILAGTHVWSYFGAEPWWKPLFKRRLRTTFTGVINVRK